MTVRERWGLGVLGVGALVLVGAMLAPDDPPEETAAVAARAPAAAPGEVAVADVKLELLQRTPPAVGEAERNLFRFRPRPTPPAPTRPPPAPVPVAPPVALPSGPPPPPAIPVRFIGLVDAPTRAGRVAILSDGRGNVFYGKEGDIIEGRYRVLKVGPDAAELSYLDGRGHQTIRLSGQ